MPGWVGGVCVLTGCCLTTGTSALRGGDPAFTGGGYSERHCPMCDETMDEPLVFDIPSDRCAAHGMWFDKKELDQALSRLGQTHKDLEEIAKTVSTLADAKTPKPKVPFCGPAL